MFVPAPIGHSFLGTQQRVQAPEPLELGLGLELGLVLAFQQVLLGQLAQEQGLMQQVEVVLLASFQVVEHLVCRYSWMLM
jgi:hypothetical protein